MKVLALGGCGAMGQPMVRDLVQNDDVSRVVIGDINTEALKRLEGELSSRKISVLPIDIYEHDSLLKAMKEVDVVAEIARHPTERRKKYVSTIVNAAIQARKDMVDAQGFPWKMELNEEAKAAGITIIHGMGVAPGTSNLLARYGADKLDEVDDIHITWISTSFLTAGATMIRLHLRELVEEGVRFQEGKYVDYAAFSDWGEVTFPEPIGKVEVCSCPVHPEPRTLAKYIKAKNIDVRMGFYPSGLRRKLETFVHWGMISPEPLEVQGTRISPLDYLTRFFDAHPTEVPDIRALGLVVEVTGRRRGNAVRLEYSYVSPGGRGTEATGVTCSVGAVMLGRGDARAKGVLPPEASINAVPFFAEMKKRGLQFGEKEEEIRTI